MKFRIIAASDIYGYLLGKKYKEKLLKNKIPYTDENVHYDEDLEVEAGKTYVELNSIEDIIKISKAVDTSLIVSTYDKIPTIEIYDDYRE